MKLLETYTLYTDGKWGRWEHYLDSEGNDIHIQIDKES